MYCLLLTRNDRGMNVRICQNGRVDGLGTDSALATFTVSPTNSYVRFQSVFNPGLYLAIRGKHVVT